MVPSLISIKVTLFSIGIATTALFLKVSIPMAVDFSVSRFPILWSSFLSWLEPPYLFVVINFIIFTIVASSKYYLSIGDQDDEILHGGDYKIQTEQIGEVNDVDLDASFDFAAKFPPPILEVERSEEEESVVVEDEIAGLTNGGNEFVAVRLQSDQVPLMMEESENLPPAEKPLVSARSGHRKPVKANPKGTANRRKALRVVKPKRHETTTLENSNTWKMMITEENKSTPLTIHTQRSETFRLDAGNVLRPALRKSETFRDVTNYQQSPAVKMKKEMSPSREELNRRVEAFIKKCKEERLESMRLDKDI